MSISQVTRLSDIIVPEVFADYIIEESIQKTGLYRSGILTTDPLINAKVGGGGETFNMPFYQRLTGDLQAIQSGGTIKTQKVTTSKMVARRLMFGQGWAREEIASALAGDDPMTAIKAMVDKYWEVQLQKILFSSIRGVIGDNQANDSGSLVKNITTTGTPGTSNMVSAGALMKTFALLGDAGEEFSAIGMHSAPYWTLKEANLIDTIPDSEQGGKVIDIFMGKRLIVTDQLSYDTDVNPVYWTIIFKQGAIGFGESGNNITVVETARNAPASTDELYTRRQLCMHPVGFKWVETSVNEDMPTLRELEEPGNWDRVMDIKNCGFAVLKSNG